MKCFNHRDIDAIGICINCGRAVCEKCYSIKGSKIYCKSCFDGKEKILENENNVVPFKDRIPELINNFDHYLNYSTNVIGLDSNWREGVVEHIGVIRRIREAENYESLIKEDSFLEDVYSTLVSWGMNWRNAKLKDLESFKKIVLGSLDLLMVLKKYELEELNDGILSEIQDTILKLFNNMNVMESKAKIVGVSKTLAHLLPDLIPPMDRENINFFFYGNKNIPIDPEQEKKRFWDIFMKFYLIRNETKITKKNNIFKDFNTSIPKMIDNAIWGYVDKNLKNKQIEINRKIVSIYMEKKGEIDTAMPIWKMVEDAANNLGSSFANKEIKDYILNKYGDVNKSTIQCMIYTVTVNNPSRINWGFNKKARIANSKYDFLFKNKDNSLEKYDQKKHGIWEIIEDSGKLKIRRIDY